MPSRTAIRRQQLKLEDPERYARFLEKEKLRNREYRAKKRWKWLNERQTRAAIEAHEKELARGRERYRRYMERHRTERSRRHRVRNSDEPTGKRPRDMTHDELLAHRAKLKREWRERQTSQKKRWLKHKDRETHKAIRWAKRLEREGGDCSPPQASHFPWSVPPSHAPPDASTNPPPDASTNPPTHASTNLPSHASTNPPPHASTYPPPHASTNPPPHASTNPPPHASTNPPPHASTYPPPRASTYPPPHASTNPPPHASTYPPPRASTYPPPHASTYPPPLASTYPPTNASTNPPMLPVPPPPFLSSPDTPAPSSQPSLNWMEILGPLPALDEIDQPPLDHSFSELMELDPWPHQQTTAPRNLNLPPPPSPHGSTDSLPMPDYSPPPPVTSDICVSATPHLASAMPPPPPPPAPPSLPIPVSSTLPSPAASPPPDEFSPPQPDTPVQMPKKLSNFRSTVKASLDKKTNKDPRMYARFVKSLANPRTPEKRKALKKINLFGSPPQATPPQRKKIKVKASSSGSRSSTVRTKREKLYASVKAFYMRYDISRQLPHKRYATKHGPGYVMNVTVRAAYQLYKQENGDVIGKSKFYQLRPRNMRRLGAVDVETCLCMYCLNIRYKVDSLNRMLARLHLPQRFPAEGKLMDILLCPKNDGSKWNKPDCVQGKCKECPSTKAVLLKLCEDILPLTINWTHWERRERKLDAHVKSDTVRELVEEFVKDIEAPLKGCTFVKHIFTAYWQQDQYSQIRRSLEAGELLMVMDFAENRKAMYNEEVKSAHFGKSQMTLHPVVCYHRSGDHVARHVLMFISDDITHDYHMVHHFTVEAIHIMRKVAAVPITKIYIFSDGCAAQYKGRGTFADLSLLSGCQVQRLFFGSEHGKGEADGETGVLSQAMDRAVKGGSTFIRGAEDLYRWAEEHLAKDEPLKRRTFVLVKGQDIDRNRPETEVVTIPGTRQLHQIERVNDYIIKSKLLGCLCEACRGFSPKECPNTEYTGDFVLHKLKRSTNGNKDLDLGFIEEAGQTKKRETRGETSVPGPSSPSTQPTFEQKDLRLPRVGEFVKVAYKYDRKIKSYFGVVVPTSIELEEEEVLVHFFKSMGSYQVEPQVPDECAVSATNPDVDHMVVVPPPRIDGRGRHFFS